MAHYVYNVIFTNDGHGKACSVNFPDIESCCTKGDTLTDAFVLAEDVLGLALYDAEINRKPIPKPTSRDALEKQFNPAGTIIFPVSCNTDEYHAFFNTTAPATHQ